LVKRCGFRYRGIVSTASPPSATHSLTLDRGLRALAVLREHPEGLSVAQLAEALQTHRPAVYRLLAPLTEHHLAVRRADSRYELGPGLLDLAAGVQPRLRERAAPYLRALADRFAATTALTVPDGDEAVVATVTAPRDQVIHLTYQTGMRHPLTSGAPGLAILAARRPSAGEPAEVTAARERGWAASTGQLLPGATGVARAVISPRGEPVGALSAVWIAGLDADHVGAAVAEAAEAVSADLRG
jgi:DNA-binding IclR family transcriptional regulator